MSFTTLNISLGEYRRKLNTGTVTNLSITFKSLFIPVRKQKKNNEAKLSS